MRTALPPVYFNEFDPQAAAWIRELMADKLIPNGEVDERSIKDVQAVDVVGRRQCHWFAGIAGWSEALRLAGWNPERPVWTGSCPCQPYSSAGKQKGNADERDLWPDFFRLISECRPQCVFGEQVPGAIKHGWLDRVHADLEPEGYTVGAVVLTAAGVGAPHIRQRLYWVAHTERTERWPDGERDDEARGRVEEAIELRGGGVARGVEHPTSNGRQQGRAEPVGGAVSGCGDGERPDDGLPRAAMLLDGVAQGDAIGNRPQRQHKAGAAAGPVVGADGGFWADSYLIPCRDGKVRRIPTQPGLFPLAHGVSGRVGLLRGAGNAICVQTAALFIRAFLEVETEEGRVQRTPEDYEELKSA